MLDVLGDYPEAVEADLAHHYPEYGAGGPVAAYWRGEITLRWLRVMVEGLPPDGAVARAARGHHWTQADYHRADDVDLLGRLVTAFLNVNRAENSPEMPYPEPVWRPGDPVPEDPATAAEEKRLAARRAFEHINAQVRPEKR
ncbi:hypothetical protein K7395_24700 [Streptomyces filamentosus]|uniref:Uncharacterized protein n=1 Tax=Streptomyces filamentosus TaxID=67294 RepID=A0ABY4UZV2_STRFL|nr:MULTISPECIES: hypothetical protein [Streptomyces]ESU46500.1 hypothetical protein P376_5521 [Streptomyces sp. HCCB10043]MYR78639.1 hypothetical protein [Streptomyces sp. SID5466]MYR78707.1 hypothetical protein [Streptomyces sp. SID5466]USC49689.1 hypothetical protein K7395_24700 [Streptomyces filamentosus]